MFAARWTPRSRAGASFGTILPRINGITMRSRFTRTLRHRTLGTALLCASLLAGCGHDNPAGPAGSDCLDPAAAPKFGFFLTGRGYSNAKTNLDDPGLGISVLKVDYVPNGLATVFVGAGVAIGGTDTTAMQMTIRLLGVGKGTFHWDDLTDGDGAVGMTLVITEGKAAGIYHSVSGQTVVTDYDINPDHSRYSGKFCGTLKDSANHEIKVSGGRFVVEY
jgi:hypothetical protein